MTNWLDRAIGWLSPQAALRRARYRQALGIALAYEGATTGRRAAGWNPGGTSANADIGVSLARLRDRSRDLVQNNPHAARAIRVIQTDTVGTGITPRPVSKSEKLNERASELWEIFARQSNADALTPFYSQQALVTRAIPESGEALVRFRTRRPEDGFKIPLQLQVLESDYLDTAKIQDLQGGGYILQGVQFDIIGRRTGYWLFPQHPGEIATISSTRFESAFVPASEILHVYEQLRPQQIRGVPWFAPVLLKFRDLAEYDEAEIVRKKIESCLAAFVTQPEGGMDRPLGPMGADDATGRNRRTEQFAPGMIEYLKPGEDVKTSSPAGNVQFSDYWISQLHSLAVGMNVMYEQLSGDLSRVNYSSFRGGMMQYRPFIEQFRWNVLIPLFCDPVWTRFCRTAYVAGLLTEPDVPVEWTAPNFQSVDPVKDADADLLELRDGTLTWPEAVARRGYDPEAQLRTIVDWNKKFDDAGIVLDCDPRKVTRGGIIQASEKDGGNNAQASTR